MLHYQHFVKVTYIHSLYTSDVKPKHFDLIVPTHTPYNSQTHTTFFSGRHCSSVGGNNPFLLDSIVAPEVFIDVLIREETT